MATSVFGAPGFTSMGPGLLGADPARTRADAFLKGLAGMAPGLLMAGAPSTDPGATQKGWAMATQGFQQGRQGELDRVRAQNLQNINMQAAAAKAAREKQLFDVQMARNQRFNQLLRPQQSTVQSRAAGTTALSLPPQLQPPITQSVQPTPVVRAAATNQSQVRVGNVTVPRSVLLAASFTADPGAELSKYVQTITKPGNKFKPDGSLTSAGRYDQEETLRDTLKKPLETLTELAGKGRAIDAALDRDSGLGDLAAINSYQRLIDDAVVRGEDVRLIEEAKPLSEYFLTFVQKLKEGKKLGDAQRIELRAAAKDFINAINGSYVIRLTNIKKVSDMDGLRWGAVWQGPSIERLSGKPALKNPPPTSTIPTPSSRASAAKVGSQNSPFNLPHQ